jgi:hypothetical protein
MFFKRLSVVRKRLISCSLRDGLREWMDKEKLMDPGLP